MRKASRIFLGVVLIVTSLFGPFYVGGRLLPDGWFSGVAGHILIENPWWTIPMAITLTAWFIGGCAFGGIILGESKS